MRNAFIFLLLVLLASRSAFAQIDTTGGRYYKPIFPDVTVTRDVVYGSANTLIGVPQQLVMDIYEPTGDTEVRRPLLIMAHEGAFVQGTKSDQPMTEICTRFARLGYVTVSIDYRLLNLIQLLLPGDTINLAKGALLATQDMRAAVRFFRKDAATTQQYRIHPGYIFAGGSSAGAFVALQTGYLDKLSEIPSFYDAVALGGLEGSNNLGYSSAVRGVVNLCGALGRREWLEAGNVPLVSLHGTNDNRVPYNSGKPGFGLPPQQLYGSGTIKVRADAVGVPNNLYTFKGAGHVPYNGTSEPSMAYMDTTFRVVRDFLRPLLRQPGTILTTTKVAEPSLAVQVYPTPATDAVQLLVPSNVAFQPREVELLDATGRIVRRFRWSQPSYVLPRGTLKAGLYMLRGEGIVPQRIVFE